MVVCPLLEEIKYFDGDLAEFGLTPSPGVAGAPGARFTGFADIGMNNVATDEASDYFDVMHENADADAWEDAVDHPPSVEHTLLEPALHFDVDAPADSAWPSILVDLTSLESDVSGSLLDIHSSSVVNLPQGSSHLETQHQPEMDFGALSVAANLCFEAMYSAGSANSGNSDNVKGWAFQSYKVLKDGSNEEDSGIVSEPVEFVVGGADSDRRRVYSEDRSATKLVTASTYERQSRGEADLHKLFKCPRPDETELVVPPLTSVASPRQNRNREIAEMASLLAAACTLQSAWPTSAASSIAVSETGLPSQLARTAQPQMPTQEMVPETSNRPVKSWSELSMQIDQAQLFSPKPAGRPERGRGARIRSPTPTPICEARPSPGRGCPLPGIGSPQLMPRVLR